MLFQNYTGIQLEQDKLNCCHYNRGVLDLYLEECVSIVDVR